MTESRWLEHVGTDGISRGERSLIDQMYAARYEFVEGKAQAARQNQALVDEIREQTEDLARAHLASATMIARDLEAVQSSLQEGFGRVEFVLNRNSDQIKFAIERSAARVAFALDRGFQSLAWGQDRLIQISEQQSFAIQHPRQIEAQEKLKSGLYAYKNRWWDDARDDLEAACGIYRYDPTPWLYRGKIAFWIKGDLPAAEQCFAQAVRFGQPIETSTPLVVEALLEGAQLRFLSNDRAAAADLASKAASLDPKNANVLVSAARFEVFAGQKDSAVRHLIDAIDIDPAVILAVGAAWAEPIRHLMLEWGAKTHIHELEPHRAVRERLTEIRSALQTHGLQLFSSTDWNDLEGDYAELSSGLLDIRQHGARATERRRNLVATVISALARLMDAQLEGFKANGTASSLRSNELRTRARTLRLAASEFESKERQRRSALEEFSKPPKGFWARLEWDLVHPGRSKWLETTIAELAGQAQKASAEAETVEQELEELERYLSIDMAEQEAALMKKLEPLRFCLAQLRAVSQGA